MAAVFAGNALEFYDFLSYSLYAVYIGKAFFPSDNPSSSLLLALATFGAGFLTRPLGGLVLGRMGDRYGRKPAMLVSFALMGTGMLGIAVTPSYASIGLAAPILAIVYRLMQGFALGGEVGASAAYMLEAAPVARRGLYCSMQYVSQEISLVFAASIGVAVSHSITTAQLEAWGWRIPFFVGLIIIPFAAVMRNRLPETHTPDAGAQDPRAQDPRDRMAENGAPLRRIAILGFFLLSAGTIGTYVVGYMTTYALHTLGLSAEVSLGTTVITSGVAVLSQPICGLLTDRVGRKPVMVAAFGLTLIGIPAVFAVISHAPSVPVFYGTIGLLNAVYTFAQVPIIIAVTESLPQHRRVSAVCIVYALAVMIFGGTTQFVVAWLTDVTHNPMAPGWYWAAATAMGFGVACLMPESAPIKLGGR